MKAPFPLALAPNFAELSTRWSAIPDAHRANAEAMLTLLQDARVFGGGVPLVVTSWYRSPLVNLANNGSKTSQHLTASAVDFTTIPPGAVRGVFDRLRVALPPSSFGQLIFERDHIHLSLPNRANGRTGEVLTEPTEGTFLPVDDSREGGVASTSTLLALVVMFALFLLLTGHRT